MIKYNLNTLSREQKRMMRKRSLRLHDVITNKEFEGLMNGTIHKLNINNRY